MRNFQFPGRSPVYAEQGACATSHPIASAVALSILKRGGNAVDAAVAASAVLGVVEPHMTGIGGDCFAIVAEADGQIFGYNGSGRAAAAARTEWFLERGITQIADDSIHAVTVPGSLKCWEHLVNTHGRLGFDAVLAPAIDYARRGVLTTPRVATDWAELAADLLKDPGACRHYLIDGRAPRVGERYSLPALGETLRKVAEEGTDAFYKGEIAAEIASLVQSYGGLLTEADLAGVSCDPVTPVFASYRGVRVAELPPNGQGITALTLLKILEQFDIGALDPHGAERHHLQLEAGRLAYAMRDAHIAAPEHMQVDVETLVSAAYARNLAGSISLDRRNAALPSVVPSQSDTVYLTVADSEGRAVSFINSVYCGFGAQICTDRSGVLLQNRGACFVVDPNHPNCIDGGKRPLHTIIPAMAMKDGKVWLSFGVMGGAYQAQGHAQVIVNMVDYGMDPQEALDCERLFWNEDGQIVAELGLSDQAYASLAAKGHVMQRARMPHGGGQVIEIIRDGGGYCAASDPRKDGLAIGY
ncbi:gamma-glutamyltransferase [uncultured Cohaesibacter sp.]|uniref:gamma-glutamyltransferase n=1 Tax=uncultured Cohaesibacter sp. TaxID=1002546 RepID=UPI0029C82F29|nr:gamma-glutamyltransferase [uncultured Cohaesibacter sp.]